MASVTWTDPMDPAEDKDYSLDWATFLNGADTITTSNWTLSAAAISAGLETDQDSNDTTSTTIWFQVNVANQSDAGFDGDGATFDITNTVTTAGGRTYERSAALTVKQL